MRYKLLPDVRKEAERMSNSIAKPAPAPEKVRRCPWQKRIETMQTSINYEIRNILFGDCLADACPYWFDMNGEKICRKVEWADD